MIIVGQNFALDALETRGDGLVHVRYVLTQPGVYSYQLRDGRTVRALKAPGDWTGDAFLNSARSVPVTIEHPAKLATPATTADHVGLTDSTPAFVRDGKVLHGATLNRQDAIDLVRTKAVKGVSAGAHVEWRENSGVFVADDGTSHPYDVVQSQPVMNHVALTRAMRVKSATFVLDSDFDALWVSDRDSRDEMDELKELLQKLSLDSSVATALTKLVSDRDASMAELARTADTLRGERDALQAKLAQAPSLDSIGARVARELATVVEIAAKVPGLSLDALARASSPAERYSLALDSLKVKVDPAASEDYLRGAYMVATSQPAAPAATIHPNSARAGLMIQDSAPKPLTAEERIKAARDRDIRRSRGENV